MAQKIKPTVHRLGITTSWANRWFFKKSLRFFIEEDYAIREIIKERILQAGIADLLIERRAEEIRINIKAGRPGLIIGRGGKGIEDLKNEIVRKIKAIRKENRISENFVLHVNIEELKRTEVSAAIIAQQIASDVERRLPFRRIIKRNLDALKQNREVKGARIRLSGRLNGAEISRSEWLAFGRMPLQTFRANIDYAEAISYNTYGVIGVKVWIYKGDIFEKN
ncbi:30S ribosomal protein S3 [Candidatus Jorgensenbacteria bacterium RIFCSPLOWO2_01_FULL_45_25b]|uniref:Small ribosomal subunit protein uS3 n=1 Tax=Candidatus Jorgensenbacteria bacterium RIFCSPLOWO2_01_FULL_45_25b TaxID=1798471 RepID=A0A1F6BV13_9BACT|nr:MAG: 30S ribosomal protein S3 [Candidatus Jorgensenbacteria bacterium RIFCSPLOWO2_01_FULL_45_25b]